MTRGETLFTVEATPFKFGPGASREAAWELHRLGVTRAFLVADPKLGAVTWDLRDDLARHGIETVLFDRVRVEPTADSVREAAAAALDARPDGFVALGGGSTIDTAKVANLLSTHGGDVLEYVNAPIGAGRKPPAPLRPLLAIPTTSGSGSEATTVAILDLPHLGVKSGISHRFLRPTLALVDPELTRTVPSAVTAAAGLDVVCHAIESFLARPYTSRPKPETPDDRPPYQGSNPVADVWSARAIEFGGRFLRRAVQDSADLEARGFMMLGATMAGVGFGSAGVHIPHACAYPVAGLKHAFRSPGYDSAFVPHGFSVVVTAPAAFRFTFDADPARHVEAARLMGSHDTGEDALPRALESLLRDVGAPTSLRELGYDETDLPALVQGAAKQQRLLDVAPKPVTDTDLEAIFRASL